MSQQQNHFSSPFEFTDPISEMKFEYPVASAIGDKQITEKTWVFTEFAPVKALVLGYMDETARFPDNDLPLAGISDDHSTMTVVLGTKYPPHIIKRAQDI